MLCAIAARAWTVRFTNPDNWTEVYVYAWEGSNEYTGAWPGKPMTKNGDVWTYTGDGTPTHIIFNNNDNNKQTGNLTFVDGATYNTTGVIGGGNEGGGNEDTSLPIYISHNLAGDWAYDAVTMTASQGVYTATINNTRGENGYVTFGIGGQITSSWKPDYRYGPATNGTMIATGTTPNPLTKATTCYAVPSGTYDVTVKRMEETGWHIS